MCHARCLRTFGCYPCLHRQTPTGPAHNDPGGISFSRIDFYQFWPLYPLLLSLLISSRWSLVRLPCKTETNHMQCVDLPGFLFVLHESAHFALCPVSNSLFPATWVYFSTPRWVPESPCNVTSFAPLPFSTPPMILIDDAVSLSKAHFAAAFRTWHLTFLTVHTPEGISWSETKNPKNILFGKPSARTALPPKDVFLISSWQALTDIVKECTMSLLRCFYHTFGRRWTWKWKIKHFNYTFENVSVIVRFKNVLDQMSFVWTPLVHWHNCSVHSLALFHGKLWRKVPSCGSGPAHRLQVWKTKNES